ncbi:MAG: 2OG-Fe(II) oxygenase [Akkermansiaceae bacterium]
MKIIKSGDAFAESEPLTDEVYDTLIDGLVDKGWCVFDQALNKSKVSTLLNMCEELWQQGEFVRAGVGRGNKLQVRSELRSDRVLWMDPNEANTETAPYYDFLEGMRLRLNRELYIGVDSWEGHFAVYPEGAFYKKHLDQHKDTRARQVSIILYLNEEWKESDGGQLRLYTDETCQEWTDIQPQMGRLVVFLAERFWHEVLPAHRERRSITGWFRKETLPIPL